MDVSGQIAGAVTGSGINIGNINCGSLTANISATGFIQSVRANSGNIGAPGAPVSIQAGSTIFVVHASQAWANLSTTASTTGRINRINCYGGKFSGTVTTAGMDYVTGAEPSGVYTTGDLDADLTISDAMNVPAIAVGGSLLSGRTIKIGHSWADSGQPRAMSFGSVAGQIVVGGKNTSGSAPYVWTSPITINGNLLAGPVYQSNPNLQAPYYKIGAAALGGGAVGLVPFRLHPEDSQYTTPQFMGGTIRMRFYGPIANTNPGTLPVQVQAQILGTWTDVSSNYTAAIVGRDLTLTAISDLVDPMSDIALPMWIRPLSNLVCSPTALSGASTVQVGGFDWLFTP